MGEAQDKIGQVYRCLICGAEVTVIQGMRGELTPRCCNEPMTLLPRHSRAFRCPVCGAEIVVVAQGPGELAPQCCNEPMAPIQVAA